MVIYVNPKLMFVHLLFFIDLQIELCQFLSNIQRSQSSKRKVRKVVKKLSLF